MKQSTHKSHSLTVLFYKSGDYFTGFEASGHAGYGAAGNDIACAAVSSAVMLVCNTITDFFREDAEVSVEENRITLKLGGAADSSSQRLLQSFYEHMKTVNEDFPKVTVKIIRE